MSAKGTTRRQRGQGRARRGEIHADIEAVVRALDIPRTVSEICAETGLHLRTVYRILRELPGLGIEVEESKAESEGPGRPPTCYQIIARERTSSKTPKTRAAPARARAAARREFARADNAALAIVTELQELGAEVERARSANVKRRLDEVHARLEPRVAALTEKMAALRWRIEELG